MKRFLLKQWLWLGILWTVLLAGTWQSGATQSGGPYNFPKSTTTGGGGISIAGTSNLTGAIGQAVLGTSVGNQYVVTAGFHTGTPCPLAITPMSTTLPTAEVGRAYSQAFGVTGGGSGLRYGIGTGALPAWANLDAGTGMLSGTPNVSGTYMFGIWSTNASGCTGTRNYRLNVTRQSNSQATVTVVGTNYDPTPSPGFVGDYSIDTVVTNLGVPITGPVYFRISMLESIPAGNPNRLKTADTFVSGGGFAGDIQTIPVSAIPTNGTLNLSFLIGIASQRVPFRFLVDLYGITGLNPGSRPLASFRFELPTPVPATEETSPPEASLAAASQAISAETPLMVGIGVQSSPVVVINPKNSNQIAVAATDSVSRTIIVRTTDNGGISWRTSHLSRQLNGVEYYVAANPTLAYGPNGELWAGYVLANLTDSANALAVCTTGDRLTFSLPNAVTVNPANSNLFESRPALAIGPTGQVYLAWDSQEGKTGQGRIRVARVSGPTITQTQVTVRSGMVAQPTLTISPKGLVAVGWHEWDPAAPQSGGQVLVSTSSNGTTFAPSIVLAATGIGYGITSPAMPEALVTPNLTLLASPADENVFFAVFTAWGSGLDVQICRSENGGQSWTGPVPLAAETSLSDQFHAAPGCDRKGNLTVAWYDTRDSGTRETVQVYFSRSTDGGRSFGTLERVTSVASNDSKANPHRDVIRNLGRRIGLGVSVEGWLAPVWTDTRNGSEDVFFRLFR